jgi:hypothetical protein
MAGGSLLTPTPIDSSSATIPWATRLRHILGLDRAIAFTVLARGWSGLEGLITVILIARFLSPSELARKQEKFLVNSLIAAVFMGFSTYFLGRSYAAVGVTSGYLVAAVIFGLGTGTWTFLKYRRQWHDV